ncbi:hypothetical protein L209DRAFT_347518 [Thermothelomyces heterothallicus CBS 203.75]
MRVAWRGSGQTEAVARIPADLRPAAETCGGDLRHTHLVATDLRPSSVVLLQEEGLLDDFKVTRVSPGISTLVGSFRDKEDAEIARLAMVQDSWIKRLCGCDTKRSLLSVNPCN